MALTKKDLEIVAALVAQTVSAAIQTQGGAQAPSTVSPDEEPVEDDAAEEAAIAAQKQEQAREHARMVELVAELLPMVIAPRHQPVFEWLAAGHGDHARAITVILRAEIMRVLPAFREAKGLGGSSTKNPEKLQEMKRIREENPVGR